MNPIPVLNMTQLFNKEMLIYSFFDIRLKKPARVIFILYLFILLLGWTLPLFLILPLNPYTAALMIGVPVGGATLMSKPIWGGKKFFSWLKTQIQFIAAPKHYYDCNAGKKLENFIIDSKVLVSRDEDYNKLRILEQRRIEMRDGNV